MAKQFKARHLDEDDDPILAVRKDVAAALAADGEYTPLLVDENGKLWVNASVELSLDGQVIAGKDAGPSQTVTRTFTQNNDISTARDITAAPTAGQKIVAMDVYISVDTACYVTIQMETSGNVLAGAYCAANSLVPFTLRGYLKGDAADKKLQMKSSVASKGACTAVYFSEA
jgi:hypothetical protein